MITLDTYSASFYDKWDERKMNLVWYSTRLSTDARCLRASHAQSGHLFNI